MKILILILSLVSVIYAQPTKTTIEDGTANSDALIWDGSKWINISKTAAQDTLGIMSGIYFLNNFAGANDSIKFKAALTELGTDATIFIPSGTYDIGTQTIDLRLYLQRNVTISGHILMTSGASIEGEGETSIIRNDISDRNVIEILGTATATTSNLSDTALLNQSDIIVVDGSIFTAGDYVWIDGASQNSPREINQVILVDADTITVKNKLYDTYLPDSTAKVTVINPIINTKIKNIKITGINDGKYLYATYLIDFAMGNCYIDSTEGGRIYYSKDITFDKNKYRYTNDTGIYVNGVKNARVIDNDIDSCDAGIVFYYYSDGGIARGNTLRDIKVDGIQTNYWSRNCVISENHLSDVKRYGILTDFGSINTRISNNEVIGNGNSAITLVQNGHICTGNIVRNNEVTAITMEVSSNTIVSGNKIIDCGTSTSHHGIYFSTTSATDTIRNSIISNNIISGISGESISMPLIAGSVADNIIISNNTINTPYRGLLVYGSLGVNANNNTILGSGSAANRFFINDSSDAVRGDYTFITQKIDLSDAALTNIPLFKPNANGKIVSITIIMTEASSADSSRYLKIGKQGDTGYYLNILSSSQTLVSQTQWKKIIFIGGWSGESILNQAVLTKNDVILLNYEGGKTGTGELIIQMEIVYYD